MAATIIEYPSDIVDIVIGDAVKAANTSDAMTTLTLESSNSTFTLKPYLGIDVLEENQKLTTSEIDTILNEVWN